MIHAKLLSHLVLFPGPRFPVVGSHDGSVALLQVSSIMKCNTMYLQEGTAFLPGSSLAGNGLLVSDGAIWRRQRQLSNPAFRSAAVQAYAKVCWNL